MESIFCIDRLIFTIFAPMKRVFKVIIVAMLIILPNFAMAQGYVKMNALYATFGVINPSVEFVMSPHSSVAFDVTFSPWRRWNGKHSQFGIMLGEYRYYFNEATSGWYVSANAGMTAFDLHRFQIFTDGKLISRQDQYGKGFGVAVGGGIGWAHHLSDRWLVDIFLTVDKIWSWYNRYESDGDIIMHPNGHEHHIKPDPFNGSVEVMPLKLGVSFGYRIFKSKR